jgi:hypothetical protein
VNPPKVVGVPPRAGKAEYQTRVGWNGHLDARS